ncbi:daptide biosynthesis RiPP recognition protein [Actinoplanes subglobosus]|uniref:Daptide biosynthesis RiPP recognition protein n=1 Tax=Actinoplanes subglobosus TaxID=1547892 RepID=A0ABV8IRX2_9ACTN
MISKKRHLMLWGTAGLRYGSDAELPGTARIVLADAAHLAAVRAAGLVGPHTVVFVPGDPDEDTGPQVVNYGGSLSEAGAEAVLDEAFYLQIQSYGLSEYMSVAGPTMIRIADESDFEVFLHDADRALATGEFPDFLTNPIIQLADLPGLGATGLADGPRQRLYVAADGTVSVSPGGSPLGRLGDPLTRLEAAFAETGVSCLGAAVPEDVRRNALADRPWLGRYLAAVDAIRAMRARGVSPVRVSGFGGRLLPSMDGVADRTDPDLPLVLWTATSAYVHSPLTGRTFAVGHSAAQTVEAFVACGSVTEAAGHVGRERVDRIIADFDGVGVLTAVAR